MEETEGVPGENSSAIAQGTLNIYCHVLVLLLVRQKQFGSGTDHLLENGSYITL